jgi:stage V sporulation protein S
VQDRITSIKGISSLVLIDLNLNIIKDTLITFFPVIISSDKINRGKIYMDNVLKVSSKSNPNSVAGAIAGALRERGNTEIQAIGAGALNQAIKAIAIARGFVAPSGVNLVFVPAFTDVLINNENRTAIKLLIGPRKKR